MPLNADTVQLGPWRTVRYELPVEECAHDELSDMQNARIGVSGQCEPRPGSLTYKAEAAISGTPTFTLVVEFKPDATTTHVVIAAGAVLYKYDSGWTDITGGLTMTAGDDNTWEWADANGTLVLTNGVDTNAIKWTGSGNATALDDDARFSKGKHIAWFDNRLWIGNVNGATGQLWYSDTAAIETWGATSFFNFGGIINGLVPTQNALTVHTTDGIYTLIATGNAVNLYHPTQRTGADQVSPLAALDGQSIVAVPGDKQLMVLKDGIYEWDGGAQIEKISHDLDDGYWDNLNTSRLKEAFALRFPRENEVWFGLPNGGSQTNMNNVVVWNYKRRSWHGPYEGFTRNVAGLIDNKPHLGGFDGILYDHDTGDDDSGAAIDSFFETGAPAPYGPAVKVRWLNARHFYDGKGDYNVTAIQLSADLTGSSSAVSMKGDGFQLDVDLLDSNTFLTPVSQLSQDVPLLGFAPTTSIKIAQNAADQSYRYWKIIARYKPLGLFTKPKPVDT
jgi:hypothetical protein